MIVGLTGKNASGKGEAAQFLKMHGFTYYSLSDEIREEAKERGIKPGRENLIRLGTELRQMNGPTFLAARVNEKILKYPGRNYIVDSIRNPAEVEELRKNADFVLIAVDAPMNVRFDRSARRGRPGDAKTLDEFDSLEEKENLKNPSGQQLDKCIEMADFYISNDGTIKEFHKCLLDLMEHLGL